MKLPKCFWIDNRGICCYGLESNGVPCKGKCIWYVKQNARVSTDYPDNTYDDTGFNGTREEDFL